MKMRIVDLGKANLSKTETRSRPVILLLLLFSALFWAGGCEGYYTAYPGYGPYYNAPYYYNQPYYGYPGSVTIAVGDRPYYVRGPGYWYGRRYYAWRAGQWRWSHGQRVWVHGRYVVRGY